MPGLKKDGSKKIRSVDNMTQSQANASTVFQEKMGHDSLDVFFEIMRELKRATSKAGLGGIACACLCVLRRHC